MKDYKTTLDQQKWEQKDRNLAEWDQNIKNPRTKADGIWDTTTGVLNGYFAYRLTRYATISYKVEQAKKAQEEKDGLTHANPTILKVSLNDESKKGWFPKKHPEMPQKKELDDKMWR